MTITALKVLPAFALNPTANLIELVAVMCNELPELTTAVDVESARIFGVLPPIKSDALGGIT
ncbi:hypothetical protein D3C87_1828020 [compost metagenome]